MEPEVCWLNSAIDVIQAGESLRPLMPASEEGDVALLKMAALLNSLRPDAACPDPGFVRGLLERVLACAFDGPSSLAGYEPNRG